MAMAVISSKLGSFLSSTGMTGLSSFLACVMGFTGIRLWRTAWENSAERAMCRDSMVLRAAPSRRQRAYRPSMSAAVTCEIILLPRWGTTWRRTMRSYDSRVPAEAVFFASQSSAYRRSDTLPASGST